MKSQGSVKRIVVVIVVIAVVALIAIFAGKGKNDTAIEDIVTEVTVEHVTTEKVVEEESVDEVTGETTEEIAEEITEEATDEVEVGWEVEASEILGISETELLAAYEEGQGDAGVRMTASSNIEYIEQIGDKIIIKMCEGGWISTSAADYDEIVYSEVETRTLFVYDIAEDYICGTLSIVPGIDTFEYSLTGECELTVLQEEVDRCQEALAAGTYMDDGITMGVEVVDGLLSGIYSLVS